MSLLSSASSFILGRDIAKHQSYLFDRAHNRLDIKWLSLGFSPKP